MRQVQYLDLDGDGIPDAVRTTNRIEMDIDGDGIPDVVDVVETLDARIDDDGVPHEVVQRLAVDAVTPEW